MAVTKKSKEELQAIYDERMRHRQALKTNAIVTYVVLAVLAVAILGGIGSCVYWVNSLPEAPPKGVMDNPEIKQWMKKNMDKRGDKYYLKPDK